MKNKAKVSSTAYRVLFLLLLLNKGNHTLDDLNEILSGNLNVARTFSKEVIIKYLSTLRSSGYKIPKPGPANNHTYTLLKAPINIKFSEEELNALAVIEAHVSSLCQKKLQNNFASVFVKISRFLSEHQIDEIKKYKKNYEEEQDDLLCKYSEYADMINKFEQYCADNQRVVIKHKSLNDNDEQRIILEPEYLKYDPNSVYISGINYITSERQLINLANIQEVKQLSIKPKYNSILSPIIFKIKGRLAKSYRLYEDEKITGTDLEKGTITIASYIDDKNMLLSRLLKYSDHCEVIYPKTIRDKMAALIQDTLKNYA